jgi:hypothetical protein
LIGSNASNQIGGSSSLPEAPPRHSRSSSLGNIINNNPVGAGQSNVNQAASNTPGNSGTQNMPIQHPSLGTPAIAIQKILQQQPPVVPPRIISPPPNYSQQQQQQQAKSSNIFTHDVNNFV